MVVTIKARKFAVGKGGMSSVPPDARGRQKRGQGRKRGLSSLCVVVCAGHAGFFSVAGKYVFRCLPVSGSCLCGGHGPYTGTCCTKIFPAAGDETGVPTPAQAARSSFRGVLVERCALLRGGRSGHGGGAWRSRAGGLRGGFGGLPVRGRFALLRCGLMALRGRLGGLCVRGGRLVRLRGRLALLCGRRMRLCGGGFALLRGRLMALRCGLVRRGGFMCLRGGLDGLPVCGRFALLRGGLLYRRRLRRLRGGRVLRACRGQCRRGQHRADREQQAYAKAEKGDTHSTHGSILR